jgi:hypothetical protein
LNFSLELVAAGNGGTSCCGTALCTKAVLSVRQRINEAGGVLTVWAVPNEDVYEKQFGDGFYIHARDLALNSTDAQSLAAICHRRTC